MSKAIFRIPTLLTLLFLSSFSSFAENVQTQRVYLSGKGSDDAVEWDFLCSKGMNSGKWSKIAVPSCWEQQGYGQYQYGIKFYGKAFPDGVADETGTYKHSFKVPESWRGKQINLIFEASMTDTEVKVNGQKAGAVHQGAFYRFSYNITERVKFGKDNLLEVFVSKESSNAGVNLAERRADYWNFGGIFRPVFLEVSPSTYIQQVSIDARADGSFQAICELNRAMHGSQIQIQIQDEKGRIIAAGTEKIETGSDRCKIALLQKSVKLWSAETPNLYRAKLSLLDAKGKIIHERSEKFGFRTIEVKESDGLYINGVRVNIRGVNRHSFRPETGRTLSRVKNLEDVLLIKSLNMNSVRMSHYPPDPEFLQICDSLGLYVMNELGGWHGHYETPVGQKLVREMVTRDVNHPSIIWWSNGNEKGWNDELNDEFYLYDPQHRPVIHPQGNFGGFETMHYRSYGESEEYMRKPEIFMPTEFLHGLYDGGHGAGLYDYWEMMRKHPRCSGGFLWVLADEGVKRSDQNGFIDNVGNYGADGIVGPHHEKEGSYYTIRDIWNPVQLMNKTLPENLRFDLENRYDFLNTRECEFSWEWIKYPDARHNSSKAIILQKGKDMGPDIAAHGKGILELKSSRVKEADALNITARDKNGLVLWTWTYALLTTDALMTSGALLTTDALMTSGALMTTDADRTSDAIKNADAVSKSGNQIDIPTSVKTGDSLYVHAGKNKFIFSNTSGELQMVRIEKRNIHLGNGPRFIAARRADRSLDQFYNHDDESAQSRNRTYTEFGDRAKFSGFDTQEKDGQLILTAHYKLGNLDEVNWTFNSDGEVLVQYKYNFNAVVDLMGIKFDYPEEKVQHKDWLGNGPYRVWQNRLHGTQFGIWGNDYNDPIPGESFDYPEFKGYFSGTRWMKIITNEGSVTLVNGNPEKYLGVYEPRDGRDQLLYTFPKTGISFLEVIPPVRNKVNATDLIGPSSQPKWVSGNYEGSFKLIFE